MSVMSKVIQTVAQVVPDREPDELVASHELIGKPIDRLDGPSKVTGSAVFSAEHLFDGLVFAALAYSTIAKGTIETIETRAAEHSLGVLHVITHRNAPKMETPPLFDSAGGPDDAGSTVRVLNTDEISWNGQPIAVVIADSLDHAEYAASLIRVTYKAHTASLSFEAAKSKATQPKIVMGDDPEVKHGDAEAALARSPYRVDNRYTTPRHNQNAIEPHATTAFWDGDKLTVYDSTQFVAGVANTLAKIFSLKLDDVQVIAPFVGGGFGGKVAMWSHVQLCVLAAKVAKAPVRLALSREGVFRIVGGRTPSEQRVALGADETGKLTALIHTGFTALTPHNDFPEQFTFPARHLYAMGEYLIGQSTVELDTVANTFMRAPGESIGGFALESAMDELSYSLTMDPIALRLRNEPQRDPIKGTAFSSRHLSEAYNVGAELFGWQDRKRVPASSRDGQWLVGQGVATAYYPCIRLPTAARVRINADGTALVQSSAQEMGMGTATAQTQIAAERLGLPMKMVRFEYGDSSLPKSNQAGGSSQTISVALAVHEAFDKVKGELLELASKHKASPLAHSKPKDVLAANGGLRLKSDLQQGETYSEILGRAGKQFVEAEVTAGMPIEMMKYSMQSFGAQFCEVRVHEQTGEVRISRWVGVFDCGRIINPKTAHSQVRGGIVMGIGSALTEETLFDERTGRILNPSLAEYHVPVHADIPFLQTHFLDIPDPITALGAHGVGEIGITGVAAAIANAVFHATGKRIRDLPITLDKLM